MESDNQKVEIVDEPKIEHRFGFSNDKGPLSSKTIRVCSIAALVVLGGIFVMKKPDAPQASTSNVKLPDVAQINGANRGITVDLYSITQEREQIQAKNKRSQGKTIVRLPGLQKIDRNVGPIPPGSLIRAVLVTGASNGPVRAEVTEPLVVQGETLIPVGAVLLGAGQSTEERLMIKFTQLILKDGSFSSIQAQAADSSDKIAGLKGSKVGHVALQYATAVGLGFVGGMSQALQTQQAVGPYGTTATAPTMKNAMLNGLSTATLQTATDTLQHIHNKTPVIEVEAGKEIYVLFDGGK